jgi:putative transposase
MPDARSDTYDPTQVGTYHCVSRCVRRAFLCGFDNVTGKSFEHRRDWIRQRLAQLGNIFAIEIIAYAVMSNHLHSLLTTRPDLAQQWSDEEVAKRWRLLFPRRKQNNGLAETPSTEELAAIVSNPELVNIYRSRLSNLSWFNRCLNENIARSANREDECKGRFWEGRFKSQRADDLSGIVACATYIDLNPIRAGICQTPEQSDYTSIQDRIRVESKKNKNSIPLPAPSSVPLLSIEQATEGSLTASEYISLVDVTGRQLRSGKASIPEELQPILKRLRINPEKWIDTNRSLLKLFPKVVGNADQINVAAKAAGQSWFWGARAATTVFMV